MDKDKVILALDEYKCANRQIKLCLEQIKYLEDEHYIQLSNSTNSRTNAISKPTEKLAMKVPDFVGEDIKSYQKEIKRIYDFKNEIILEINQLSYKHRYVIIKFYLEGKTWVYISSQINYSVRHCKNIRTSAVVKLAKQFKANKIISDYLCKK